jgi:putative MATE family efflux protein
VVVNLVNVGLDFVLIYGHLGAPAMGVVGAAWASAVAGFVGAVLGGALVFYRHRTVITQKGRIFDPVRARQVIATNGNLFGRTACLLFTQFFGMAVVSRMGDTPLAAHAIAWQIWSIVSYFVDGFAHAAETLVGNALGRRDRGQAIAFGRRCMVWGSGIGLMFGIGYLVSVPFLAGLFTNHAAVIAQVAVLTALLSLMQPVGGAVYILDGILIGANDTRFLFFAMAVGAFAVYLPVILVGGRLLPGLVGVWVAYNALMLARFSMLWIRFRGRRWLPEDKAISLDTPTGCI